MHSTQLEPNADQFSIGKEQSTTCILLVCLFLVICTADLDRSCPGWAATGWCEKNKDWMLINCCISCKYHQAPGKQCHYFSFNSFLYRSLKSGATFNIL